MIPPKIIRLINKELGKIPIINQEITSLGDYLSALDGLTSSNEEEYWFRGHSSVRYKLIPNALRYEEQKRREKATKSIDEFKRIYSYKLDKPPADDDLLRWNQLAQHYGLPTRLLDWTLNPLVALYFCCCSKPTEDGIIYFFDPKSLNRLNNNKVSILSIREDKELIESYLNASCSNRRNGKKILAILPTWNSERIILQQGAFTLHGNRFELDNEQAPTLMCLPILSLNKKKLKVELEKVGVSEMHIFPEPEHVCNYLKGKI